MMYKSDLAMARSLMRKATADGNKAFTLVIMVVIVLSILILTIVNQFLMNENKPKVVYQMLKGSTRRSMALNGIKRLPEAIIIGSRKSGTRALLKFLTANEKIRVASKEVHFFDRLQNYKLGLDWYRDQMPLSLVGDVTIEKSPAYLVTKEAPARIKAMNSSIKLILIMRDPVIRLISDFSQLIAHRRRESLELIGRDYDEYYASQGEIIGDSPTTIQTNMTEELWSKAEVDFEHYLLRPDGGIDEQRRAIRASMYPVYLERWLRVFNRDQFHFVDGERLINDPASELHQLEIFLGLKPVISKNQFVFNHTKGFYCMSERAIGNDARANSTLKIMNDAIYSLGGEEQDIACLGGDKGRRHVRVREELMNELKEFYAPYNEYLYSLIGKDFNWSTKM